ncbi:MAG: GHKL domain-containing protein [Opitutae bacterium]|jgi:two-component system, OmpR family, phosphate regulon sensor histidine kinase PhoR|nr:GHKL domain-containing protein [Opitutae bacterium]MBT5715458.1 GHKL domain-containing protein [Opitutae bacterium]
MSLPIWLFVLMLIGSSYAIYVSIKAFITKKKESWPKHFPQKRELKDKDEQSRRDFVANVSHELRTPVSIIKGFADSLIEDYEVLKDEKRKQFLAKIQKNAKRLNTLVEDLLALAKLEKPQTTLSIELFDLCKLVRNIEEEFLLRKETPLPKFVLKCPNSPVFTRADPVKLVSVFENLIDNAMLHAEGLSYLMICIKEDTKKKQIICEVEDDGIGISQEDQEMLFERFYRVEKGRSRMRGGTGLGLSIAREIIKAHNGEISIQSKTDQGAVFSFHIPKS